jgi:uncharacterized protein (DUF1684 family)
VVPWMLRPTRRRSESLSDPIDGIDFIAAWEQWHHEHEERRARPHGFLAVTGLHWLSDDPERFDDVPGVWSSTPDGVDVQLADAEELNIDAVRVTGHYHFDHVDEHGTPASFGNAIVEVARRDGSFMIRPRDPNHEVRRRYSGTPTYAASIDWVASGTLDPYDEPRPITVGATVEGLTHVYMSPGEIEFELAGQTLRLIAFNGEEVDDLFIVFTDLTSGTTSYAACRFLNVDAPVEGHVTLDFNRATNPPCAYSDFATCPLPPSGNNLPVRVEAGEMMPLGSRTASN